MDEKKIARINLLYRKSKTEGLTEAEKKEQADLRREYIFANSNFNREDHFMELGGVVEDGR